VNVPRRAVLAGLGALAAAPALGFGDASKVDIAEVDVGPGSLSLPNAWKRLLFEMIQTTSVDCRTEVARVKPDDPALFEHPFAVLSGDGAFADPSDAAVELLGRYLSYGGMLICDDATGAEDSPFDASVRALLGRLFPTRPLTPLPSDHSVFRSFFLIQRPVGRVDRFLWLEGVTVGSATPVILMRNDLSGALDRGDDGRPRYPCVPGGEDQRREAIKLGINLMMYALTADYKRDIAHVRQLMREGRIE
jgi:hypothetical protein